MTGDKKRANQREYMRMIEKIQREEGLNKPHFSVDLVGKQIKKEFEAQERVKQLKGEGKAHPMLCRNTKLTLISNKLVVTPKITDK